MQRALTLFVVIAIAAIPHVIVAQAQEDQTYQSDTLGVAFQCPADWQISEQLAAHNVMAASAADLTAIKAGRAPTGLLFTVNISSFRLLGIHSLDDFAPFLQSIAGTNSAQPTPIKIGSAQGLSLEWVDANRDVASRTAIVSMGERRLAVVRGIATASGWKSAGEQLDKLLASLVFTLPLRNDLDSYGQVLWQAPVEKLNEMIGIAASPDGSSIYITGRTQGILSFSATGFPGDVVKVDGIAAFGGIGVLDNGTQIVADPDTHMLWQIASDTGQANPLISGKAGSGDGEFGASSPQAFTFGLGGVIYVLDQAVNTPRIEVYNRMGKWTATWNLNTMQGAPIKDALLSSDDSGNVYLLGTNHVCV